MTDAAFELVVGLFTQPEYGVPLSVAIAAFLVWLARDPADAPPPPPRRSTYEEPRDDPVSRAYHAVDPLRVSRVAELLAGRLDDSVRRHYGVSVTRLPRTWLGWRLWGVPARPSMRHPALRLDALRREAGDWEARAGAVQGVPWRSPERVRARLVARAERLHRETEAMVTDLRLMR